MVRVNARESYIAWLEAELQEAWRELAQNRWSPDEYDELLELMENPRFIRAAYEEKAGTLPW